MPPWQLMLALALGLYAGSKGLTWWRARHVGSPRIVVAYLLAWPGMDLREFVNPRGSVTSTRPQERLGSLFSMVLGGTLLWGICPTVSHDIARGWVGMVGIVFILHLGIFHLLSLGWRSAGMGARPLFDAPLRATSLGMFWARRWNRAFHQLIVEFVYRPCRNSLDPSLSIMLGFVVSGLVHDLVISVPAGGGYGLPTAYFCLQGLGLLFERSRLGKRLGLGRSLRGWLFTVSIVAVPAYWLFHPTFVGEVMVPFLDVLGAGRW